MPQFIGKERYDALPGMFVDEAWAAQYDQDVMLQGWVNMFPHKTRAATVTVDMLLHLDHKTSTFKKVYQLVSIE